MTTNTMNTSSGRSWVSRFCNGMIPVCIVCSYAWLATYADLRLAIPELLGVTAVVTSLLALVLAAGQREWIRWSPLFILLVAALCRAAFLFQPPQLSDDLFRYLWDGLQILHGHNPYALAPSAVTAWNGDLLSKINHPQLVTIYPPMAQLVFAGGALWGGSVLGMKLFLGFIDLAACGLILLLLRRFGKPAWLAVLYAWAPLPVLEIAGSGHIDGAAIFLLLASLWLLATSPRSLFGALSGSLFSAAVLVKIFPVVFLPCWWRVLNRRQRIPFMLAGLVSGFLLSWLFWPELANAWNTLQLYATRWEFSGFLFRLLRLADGEGGSSRLLLGAMFFACVIVIQQWLWRKKSSAPEEPFLLALRAGYATVLCFLLLTTTLHPWYALYLVMFLPFTAGSAGFVLSWSVLLTYRVLIPYALLGQWQESTEWSGILWGTALLAGILGLAVRQFRHQRRPAIAPSLPCDNP